MEKHKLLQSFAINNLGDLVSVREVERGKACNCCCPACGEVLIARQGEVRIWHFAHASGAECGGAAETALHLAAKQLILQDSAITTPSMEVTASRTLPDGRKGSGTARLPGNRIHLREIQLEFSLGRIRPDVLAQTDNGSLIIEIAVTHPVDLEKAILLEETGIASMEITLAPHLFEEWSWETLREAVIDSPFNRHWVYHPEKERLQHEVEEQALAAAEAEQLPGQTGPTITRLRLNGIPTYLRNYAWGFSLWYPYNDQMYVLVKRIAAQFGGRWRPKYRNWSFPSGVREAVETELRALGAVDG